MTENKKNTGIRINGIILASGWDNDGNPVDLTLYATDETEYRLGFDKKFLDFLKKPVVVTAADLTESEGIMELKQPIMIQLN